MSRLPRKRRIIAPPAQRGDLLRELIALRELSTRRIVGLMSGTSADGIDAAIVDISGHTTATEVELIAFDTVPFDPPLKRRIWELPDCSSATLCELNFLLGEAFAAAVFEVASATGLDMSDLHLIGSHGQTARHHPPATANAAPSTLQIGEGAVIAERTGLPVVCDFRVADVAAGGHGAPLITLADYLLFRGEGTATALLNLGGIANVQLIRQHIAQSLAFDIGPANMALDTVARVATGGSQTFDRDGVIAASGTVDQPLLQELLTHPYFSMAPPKSTGRETFGRAFAYPLIDRYPHRLADLMATLIELTVETIAAAFEQHILPATHVDYVYVSGGGVDNTALMRRLKERLAPIAVDSVARAGMDPAAKEAIGFAVLANEWLHCNPGNVPHTTGAHGPRILGKLALPPPR